MVGSFCEEGGGVFRGETSFAPLAMSPQVHREHTLTLRIDTLRVTGKGFEWGLPVISRNPSLWYPTPWLEPGYAGAEQTSEKRYPDSVLTKMSIK